MPKPPGPPATEPSTPAESKRGIGRFLPQSQRFGRLGEARRGENGITAGFLIPPGLARDLDELRLSLIKMRPDEFEPAQFESVRREISCIRLHLKRLELERLAIQEDARRRDLALAEPPVSPG